MSDIDWNSALERLQTLFNSNNEGTDIPDIVKAVLGDEADEEFIDLAVSYTHLTLPTSDLV